MSWISDNIQWVLIVCGLATCSMLVMAIVPRFAVRFIFGEELATPSATLIARSWGAMIFASGLLLIASAGHPYFRTPVMLNAIAGKLGFTLLVFANGKRYLARPAFPMAIADLMIVLLFTAWLAR